MIAVDCKSTRCHEMPIHKDAIHREELVSLVFSQLHWIQASPVPVRPG